jgi:hypothetical protein
MNDERAIFTLRIAGRPGQAGIRDLRALLKILLRRHGFICLHAQEEPARKCSTNRTNERAA